MQYLRRLLILSAAAACLLPALALAATEENDASRESPVQSARAVLSDDAYQSDLPNRAAPQPAREVTPAEAASRAPRVNVAPIEPRSETDGALAKHWFIAAAVLVGAALLAYVLIMVRRARRQPGGGGTKQPRRRKAAATEGAATAAAAPINAPTILDEADRLAGEGRYADAIHFLLLNALDYIARRARRHIPPALTSREILHAQPMAENMSGALSVLVMFAERGHFGGTLLSAAEYGLCREKFRLFALESGGRAS